MLKPNTRRNFLSRTFFTGTALAGLSQIGVAPLTAIEPIRRNGKARLSLSLAAYSFRDFFLSAKAAAAKNDKSKKQIDMFQFIDFCADHGCLGTELTSYYFAEPITNDYLIQLKRQAFFRGIAISGTAVGNTFTVPPGPKRDQEIANVKTWIDRAQILGAPHIRVFAGSASGISKAEAQKLCVAALEECCDYAGQKGIVLGIENHGGIVSEPGEIIEIMHAVKSPWVGINLDTGNFHTADPYGDLAKIAPYAVNVQIKSEIHAQGKAKELADLGRLIQILRDANYQGYVALEYEAAEDPWTAVPRLLHELGALMRN